MDKFVVLGAGVTGMTAASELSRLGADVSVIEESSVAGGHVASYCCKATDSCTRCGVCIAHTKLAESLRDERVRLYTASKVESFASGDESVHVRITQRQPAIDYSRCTACGACLRACPVGCIETYDRGGFTQYVIDYDRCLLQTEGSCAACLDACDFDAISAGSQKRRHTVSGASVLIATGHSPFAAESKARYGYGRHKKVMTGLDAEQALSTAAHFGDPGEDVAFVQCVGSRDPVIGRNFCSGVCCAYALRLARMLKYRNADMSVTVYYIDLQNFDKHFTSLRREIEDLGVSLVRGLPFRIDEDPDGRLSMTVEKADGEATVVKHDRVVLSIGIDRRPDANAVAELFGLARDEYGFYASAVPRVYVGGTCRAPMSIPESISAARAVAAEMWSAG